MTEENLLADVELGVVTTPRATAGFADQVLARFATTEAAIAVAKRRRIRRAAWVAGGALGAAVAVLAVVLLWPAPEPTLESGIYAAAEPHHLEVGGLAVDLERGATVVWTFDHDRLRVAQRGGATWTVPAGHHLRVEAAGVGAVDATDATLRVEARMNLMDTKLIGATAAAAALAATFAVAVTRGKATVLGAGKGITLVAGQSTSVSEHGDPVVTIKMDLPIAVEVVFPGDATWTAKNLEAFESALDHVELPPNSTIGAVSYASGKGTLRAEATPKARFGAGWLGFVSLYQAGTEGALAEGVAMGIAQLEKQQNMRKLLVVVGDGNDPGDNHAKLASLLLHLDARKAGIEMRSVLLPGRGAKPGVVEVADIPVIDAGKLELTHAMAQAMDGAVEAPEAVILVYEGRGMWLNPDVLNALTCGLTAMDLAPDSRIGAIEFSTGAAIRVPLALATSFKKEQLGTAKDYAAKRGSDLIQGVTMGLAELAKARESNKVLIVVGDGHDTNDASALIAAEELRAQAKIEHVRIRAVQMGGLDTLPGDVLKRLDPHLIVPSGTGYAGRLNGVSMFVKSAAEEKPEGVPPR
jgi:hypothetical protein